MDINSVYVGSNLSPHTTPSLFYLHLWVLKASVGRSEVPKWQEEINCKWQTFSFLCWWHLVLPELIFLKLWANQLIFLMRMFFLSYINETMYLLWNLPFFKSDSFKTNFFLKLWGNNNNKPISLTHGNVFLNYANEAMY